MESKNHSYVVFGEPCILSGKISAKGWDMKKQERLIFQNSIRDQHQDKPRFNGPLMLEAKFYFNPGRIVLKKNRSLHSRYHLLYPDLNNLIKYIIDNGAGILFDKESMIASISCKKLFDEQSRTEFTIVELK